MRFDVMPGLVPDIRVFLRCSKDVDARIRGHDVLRIPRKHDARAFARASTQRYVASEVLNSLRAALGCPGAGTAAAGPRARAHATRKTADAVGALVAVADLDRHRAVALHAA